MDKNWQKATNPYPNASLLAKVLWDTAVPARQAKRMVVTGNARYGEFLGIHLPMLLESALEGETTHVPLPKSLPRDLRDLGEALQALGEGVLRPSDERKIRLLRESGVKLLEKVESNYAQAVTSLETRLVLDMVTDQLQGDERRMIEDWRGDAQFIGDLKNQLAEVVSRLNIELNQHLGGKRYPS